MTLRRYPQRRETNFAIILRPDAPLDIGLEANVDAGNIRVPDGVNIRPVSGLVTDEAGVAVPSVEVRAVSPGREWGVSSEPVLTDAQGRFLISVIAGRIHELAAEDRSPPRERTTYRVGRSASFDAASSPGPMTLVVKAP